MKVPLLHWSRDALAAAARGAVVWLILPCLVIGIVFFGQPARALPLLQVESVTPTVTDTQPVPATQTATVTATSTNVPTPTPTSFPVRTLVINEIAWMGTRADGTSEWIELYNPGVTTINLNGWTLISLNSSFEIALSGSIGPGGYFLLESFDDTAVANINANQVYSSRPLSNTGEMLALRDPYGYVIDTANQGAGVWPAGNVTIFCSMERSGATKSDLREYWITNNGQNSFAFDILGNPICGSPGQVNWAYSVTATPITPTSAVSYTPTATEVFGATSTRTATITRTVTLTRTITPTRTVTRTRTPIISRTPTLRPKRTLTPTRNPNATPPSIVVINEFLPQPRSDWNNDGLINSGDGYIEIINLGILPVVLTGWVLDDQPGDSNPFTISNITIQPQTHIAFFSSKTGILLSSGGDTVRLIRTGGVVSDAFTYGLIKTPDQSWCRLPDGKGPWGFGCGPTAGFTNKEAQSVLIGNRPEAAFCLSDKQPEALVVAECDPIGLFAWDKALWQVLSSFPRYFDSGNDVFILD